MAKTHNKKRNVGIIYDQIISQMCESYIENDTKSVKKLLNIIKENFKKGSQLQKELQFFNSFIKTRGISESLSLSIIKEAKSACKNHFNKDRLNYEKSRLIKDLNYSFGKGKIFEKKVENYKTYATIQTLLNEWRNENNNFSEEIKYEFALNEWLTSENDIIEENYEYKDVDNITLSIMNKKFNDKYFNLSQTQKSLIENYITSIESDEENLNKHFQKIKADTLGSLSLFKESCDNKHLNDKLNVIIDNIKSLDCNLINEENIKKFLVVSKLKDEIESEN